MLSCCVSENEFTTGRRYCISQPIVKMACDDVTCFSSSSEILGGALASTFKIPLDLGCHIAVSKIPDTSIDAAQNVRYYDITVR